MRAPSADLGERELRSVKAMRVEARVIFTGIGEKAIFRIAVAVKAKTAITWRTFGFARFFNEQAAPDCGKLNKHCETLSRLGGFRDHAICATNCVFDVGEMLAHDAGQALTVPRDQNEPIAVIGWVDCCKVSVAFDCLALLFHVLNSGWLLFRYNTYELTRRSGQVKC